ncbi:hypothetical protein [Yersinia kristensenii]|uniref:hypothetical protein n=1 Tax=Yersinia kristensenii TaxID=28152 RepID=UPI001C97D201|nr:hypothetical protein [Yersinia kristensenii]
MYFYSAKTGGFYPAEIKADYINAGNFPDDCISVEDNIFIEFAGSKPPEGNNAEAIKQACLRGLILSGVINSPQIN